MWDQGKVLRRLVPGERRQEIYRCGRPADKASCNREAVEPQDDRRLSDRCGLELGLG